MEVKNIIREKRLELGLTYEELGKMVGVGKSTVRKWETGMIENIKRDNIVLLAKALNISPALIMGWDIKKENKNNELINTNYEKQNNTYLSKEETILLENYNKLNDLGKEEANKRIAELTIIPTYTNESLEYIYTTMAAHNDNLDNNENKEADSRILEALKKRRK